MRSIWKRRIKYILLKTIEMTIILIVLSAIVFAISRLCPGNPLRAYYGDGIEHMTTAEKNTARENLGLNDPLLIPVSYTHLDVYKRQVHNKILYGSSIMFINE